MGKHPLQNIAATMAVLNANSLSDIPNRSYTKKSNIKKCTEANRNKVIQINTDKQWLRKVQKILISLAYSKKKAKNISLQIKSEYRHQDPKDAIIGYIMKYTNIRGLLS